MKMWHCVYEDDVEAETEEQAKEIFSTLSPSKSEIEATLIGDDGDSEE